MKSNSKESSISNVTEAKPLLMKIVVGVFLFEENLNFN